MYNLHIIAIHPLKFTHSSCGLVSSTPELRFCSRGSGPVSSKKKKKVRLYAFNCTRLGVTKELNVETLNFERKLKRTLPRGRARVAISLFFAFKWWCHYHCFQNYLTPEKRVNCDLTVQVSRPTENGQKTQSSHLGGGSWVSHQLTGPQKKRKTWRPKVGKKFWQKSKILESWNLGWKPRIWWFQPIFS